MVSNTSKRLWYDYAVQQSSDQSCEILNNSKNYKYELPEILANVLQK